MEAILHTFAFAMSIAIPVALVVAVIIWAISKWG